MRFLSSRTSHRIVEVRNLTFQRTYVYIIYLFDHYFSRLRSLTQKKTATINDFKVFKENFF